MTETQIASNSIQTLCIAIEAYISQKSNFFSDTILEKAIELLANGFDGSPNLTGAASSEILLAEGEKESMILSAEAQKQAEIDANVNIKDQQNPEYK